MHGRVPQSPLVQVYGVQGTEAIEVGEVVRGHSGQPIECLQERVVGELERRMDRHWGRQGLTSHSSHSGGGSWEQGRKRSGKNKRWSGEEGEVYLYKDKSRGNFSSHPSLTPFCKATGGHCLGVGEV